MTSDKEPMPQSMGAIFSDPRGRSEEINVKNKAEWKRSGSEWTGIDLRGVDECEVSQDVDVEKVPEELPYRSGCGIWDGSLLVSAAIRTCVSSPELPSRYRTLDYRTGMDFVGSNG